MKPEPATTVPPAPTHVTVKADDTEEIREQIERTREDMGRTIDELSERLNPQHVMQQAKDSLHDATVGRVTEMVSSAGSSARDAVADVAERAQDTAGTLVDEMRAHPVTTALIGVGVAWLLGGTSLFQRRRSYQPPIFGPSGREGQRSDAEFTTGPRTAYTDRATSYRSNFKGEHDMGNGYRQGSWTDMLRDHPVPTALAAVSIGYLVMQRDSGARSSGQWRSDRDPLRRYEAGSWELGEVGDRATRASRGLTDTAYETASEVRQTVGEFGEKVNEWGEQVSDSVRRAGAQARQSASDVSETVQERWQTVRRRTSNEFEEWMNDNPLAVGAAALAAGLAIGFTSPRTRFEDDTMGATRDALLERTSEAAEDAAHQLTEGVKNAASLVTGDTSSSSSPSASASSPSGAPSPSSASSSPKTRLQGGNTSTSL